MLPDVPKAVALRAITVPWLMAIPPGVRVAVQHEGAGAALEHSPSRTRGQSNAAIHDGGSAALELDASIIAAAVIAADGERFASDDVVGYDTGAAAEHSSVHLTIDGEAVVTRKSRALVVVSRYGDPLGDGAVGSDCLDSDPVGKRHSAAGEAAVAVAVELQGATTDRGATC